MEKVINNKNQLLVKDDVGRSKPITRDMPPEGFTFGKPDRKDPEGASIVTQSWKAHEQSRPKDPERDFKKLNKLGIKNKAIDPKVRKLIALSFYRNKKNSDRKSMLESSLSKSEEGSLNLLSSRCASESLTVLQLPLMVSFLITMETWLPMKLKRNMS